MEHAYLDPNPLLPYTELPTIGISGAILTQVFGCRYLIGRLGTDRSMMKVVFTDILQQLNTCSDESGLISEDSEEEDAPMDESNDVSEDARIAFTVSLSQTECTNLQSTMKALIGGLINQSSLRSGQLSC